MTKKNRCKLALEHSNYMRSKMNKTNKKKFNTNSKSNSQHQRSSTNTHEVVLIIQMIAYFKKILVHSDAIKEVVDMFGGKHWLYRDVGELFKNKRSKIKCQKRGRSKSIKFT